MVATQKFLVAEQVTIENRKAWQLIGYITKLPKRWMISESVEDTKDQLELEKAARWLSVEKATDVTLSVADKAYRVAKA